MTTDIIKAPTPPMDIMTMGQMLSQSGYFQDARDAAQAVVKVLAGQEMNIGPIAAMTGIYIVKGRVTLSANLMAAQIKRSGRYSYRVTQLDDTGCAIIFLENGQEIGCSSFTQADAQKAGLWNSSEPWKKTPRNMMFARAMSNGAKWYCPDVFSGPVYTPDELNGPSLEDDAPRAEIRPVVEVQPRQLTPPPEAQSEIDRLQRDLKALRECERSIGLPLPIFSWKKSQGPQPLKDEIKASRKRIEATLPGLIEGAGGLLEGSTDQATADQLNRYRTIDAEMLSHADLIDMAAWLFNIVANGEGVEVEEGQIAEPAL